MFSSFAKALRGTVTVILNVSGQFRARIINSSFTHTRQILLLNYEEDIT